MKIKEYSTKSYKIAFGSYKCYRNFVWTSVYYILKGLDSIPDDPKTQTRVQRQRLKRHYHKIRLQEAAERAKLTVPQLSMMEWKMSWGEYRHLKYLCNHGLCKATLPIGGSGVKVIE